MYIVRMRKEGAGEEVQPILFNHHINSEKNKAII